MAHLIRSRHSADDQLGPLRPLVDEWLAEGIVSPEQAQRMLAGHAAAEQTAHYEPVPTSAAVEAAGYLGGSLVVVATMLIGAQYWSELTTTVRISAAVAAVVALLVAGILVSGHGGRAGERLVAVLWLASTVAVVGLLALVTDASSIPDEHALPVAASGTAAYAATLWAFRPILVQQIATMIALMTAVATTVGDLTTTDSLPGIGVWAVAAGWLILGWVGRLRPRRAVMTLGAAAMVFGAMTTIPTTEGFVLAFGTVASVAALGVARHDPLLLGVAALGSLQVFPAVVMEWFPNSSLAPFALLAVGVLMVAAAVWMARGRQPSHGGRRRRRPHGGDGSEQEG